MTESIETEILTRCPCCDRTDTDPWCFATDLLLATTTQTYEYHRCRGCSVLYLAVRPRESEAGRMYPSDYHPYASEERDGENVEDDPRSPSSNPRIPASTTARIKKLLNWRIPRDYKKLGKGDVVLDFGCGAGKFLDRMRARGCATTGMDFSPHALAAVAKGGHLALPVSTEGWGKVPLSSVDFVRMNHVVEHLYHARETFDHIRERMKPGGILHIAVPNPNGFSAFLFRRYWHGLDCPRHIILYPPATLGELLADCGFSVTSIVQETLAKDYIRSWVYRVQAAGWLSGKNPDDYLDVPGLQVLAAVPMLLASLIGRSDRFHVVAKRER